MAKITAITRPADFKATLRDGRRTSAGTLVIHVRNAGSGSARLGMAVRAPRAIVRNRVKRRLRSAFLEASPPSGIDVLVKAGPGAIGASFQELVTTYKKAFSRLANL